MKNKKRSDANHMVTVSDLMKYQNELTGKFGLDAQVAYSGISWTQLSVARHYGGAKVNGKHYIYNPADDSLIREDVLKWIAKKQREEKKAAKEKGKQASQNDLGFSKSK